MKLSMILGLGLTACALVCNADETLNPEVKVSPLLETASIQATPDHNLSLEPGVSSLAINGGYQLSTFDGSKLELETTSGKVEFTSPLTLRSVDGKLKIEGHNLSTSSVTARRAVVQDDTDSNLKSMQESAKKLKTKVDVAKSTQGEKSRRYTILYQAYVDLMSKIAIQQKTHLSPIGF